MIYDGKTPHRSFKEGKFRSRCLGLVINPRKTICNHPGVDRIWNQKTRCNGHMIEHSFYLLLDDTDTVLMHIFVTTNGVFLQP